MYRVTSVLWDYVLFISNYGVTNVLVVGISHSLTLDYSFNLPTN